MELAICLTRCRRRSGKRADVLFVWVEALGVPGGEKSLPGKFLIWVLVPASGVRLTGLAIWREMLTRVPRAACIFFGRTELRRGLSAGDNDGNRYRAERRVVIAKEEKHKQAQGR